MVYRKIIEDAFHSGVENAWGFWQMTPAEINGRLDANTTKLKEKSKNMDLLAWLIGNYVRTKAFPDKPNMVTIQAEQSEPMDDEDIKSRLSMFADIHNAIEDVSQ